ncbi:hypothetical protein BFR35_04350 [Brochothrix thermosphacta]|uniref:DUF1798 domain-containing protein n=2 Tax=Listeriaceae TaxID=186820 RepID=A0A1D2K9D3_BROTH|nr:hypothetical protein BFC19_02305 [Brochothrix thermosphacta]SLM92495.1 hypothetical protein FM106_04920 [Brachybacterium faecium]ANZ97354.1 hypothetical protein BFC20_06485 [Brochothrix thermosphacta]ATF26787.1 DUF1798 domain-containing protein [Brochothrix thermosphacta]ATH86144.1 DUF1798 domain-containing protein [Brochothrix thermosphacta]
MKMIEKQIQAVLDGIKEVEAIKKRAENGETFDFRTDIEPFVNRMSEIAEIYKKEGVGYIQKTPVKYMSDAQIITAGDNLKRLAVSCFAPKVNETQYNRHIYAVTYTQERFLEGLTGGELL